MSSTLLLASFILLYPGAHSTPDRFEDTLGELRARSSAEVQRKAVSDLTVRLLGSRGLDLFDINVDPDLRVNGKDVFQLKKGVKDKKVSIVGSSGVAAAWGLHHYLKYKCKCHISWDGDQLELPENLSIVDLTITAQDRLRFYQNVCTWSYSFVWWDWKRWERELDWMALNGINLALAFSAQEYVWEEVYLQLGLTQQQIDQHFSGPAFLAWSRMGNMRGWGGPLSPHWHRVSVSIHRKMLNRMRELGIVPVIPAFAGQVPRAFDSIFPSANLTKLSQWNYFQDQYCCPYLLSPEDPLFSKVGSLFLQTYIKMFGTDHVYSCDTFNEMTPSSGDVNFIKSIGESIYAAIASVDNKAIWLLQGWLFHHDSIFWTKERAKALLTSVPNGKMLILDLQSEHNPQFQKLDSYFGQPFIWCMLHNFGGTLGLHGSAQIINEAVFEARKEPNSTMVGTGITPEGINQNYVIYDLMMEMAWRKQPSNLTQWFNEYAERRYGQENKHVFRAWQFLKKSVYNYTGNMANHGKYILVHSPALNLDSKVWYDPEDVLRAWDEIIFASHDMDNPTETFKYDLVDITRQSLQVLIDTFYLDGVTAFKKKDEKNLILTSMKFIQAMMDIETILATNDKFLLGNWLEAAKSFGITPLEKQILERNARNQITLWGPNGEIMDYANKQWSGLFKDYYQPRWEKFWIDVLNSVLNHIPFNQSATSDFIFRNIEQPFSYKTNLYSTNTTGDPIATASKIHRKWRQDEPYSSQVL